MVRKLTSVDVLRQETNKSLAAHRNTIIALRESRPHRSLMVGKGGKRKPTLRLAIVAVMMLVRLYRAILAQRDAEVGAKRLPPPSSSLPQSRPSSSSHRLTAEVGGRPRSSGHTSRQPLKSHKTKTPLSISSGMEPDAVSVASTDSDYDESSSDDDDQKVGGRFFPSAKDMAEFPPSIVNAVYGSAVKSLRRCVDIIHLKRVLRFRRTKWILPSRVNIPASMWDSSIIFQGWPASYLSNLAEFGHVERCPVGELLYFYKEPTTHLKFVIDGAVAIIGKKATLAARRRSTVSGKLMSEKKVSSVNGRIVARLDAPICLRETVALIEERHEDAVEVTSACEILVIPIEAVRTVFETLPPQVRQVVNQRLVERRQQLLSEVGIAARDLLVSPLFALLTGEQLERVRQSMIPRCFLQGANIVKTDDPENKLEAHCVFIVVRGIVKGYNKAKNLETGKWEDTTFAAWGPGESLGEKSVYFTERFLFDVRSETHTDTWALPRAALMQLIAVDRSLKQNLASGAFSIRCRDPAVGMMIHTVRSMPCIRRAVRDGLLTESHVREIHQLFEFRIFPGNELITSASAPITEMYVVMVGHAMSDVSGTLPFITPKATVLGSAGVVSMRWRYATLAQSSCEGWALSVEKLRTYFKGLGILSQMKIRARETREEELHSDHSKLVMEIPRPPLPGPATATRSKQHRRCRGPYARFQVPLNEDLIAAQEEARQQAREKEERALAEKSSFLTLPGFHSSHAFSPTLSSASSSSSSSSSSSAVSARPTHQDSQADAKQDASQPHSPVGGRSSFAQRKMSLVLGNMSFADLSSSTRVSTLTGHGSPKMTQQQPRESQTPAGPASPFGFMLSTMTAEEGFAHLLESPSEPTSPALPPPAQVRFSHSTIASSPLIYNQEEPFPPRRTESSAPRTAAASPDQIDTTSTSSPPRRFETFLRKKIEETKSSNAALQAKVHRMKEARMAGDDITLQREIDKSPIKGHRVQSSITIASRRGTGTGSPGTVANIASPSIGVMMSEYARSSTPLERMGSLRSRHFAHYREDAQPVERRPPRPATASASFQHRVPSAGAGVRRPPTSPLSKQKLARRPTSSRAPLSRSSSVLLGRGRVGSADSWSRRSVVSSDSGPFAQSPSDRRSPTGQQESASTIPLKLRPSSRGSVPAAVRLAPGEVPSLHASSGKSYRAQSAGIRLRQYSSGEVQVSPTAAAGGSAAASSTVTGQRPPRPSTSTGYVASPTSDPWI